MDACGPDLRHEVAGCKVKTSDVFPRYRDFSRLHKSITIHEKSEDWRPFGPSLHLISVACIFDVGANCGTHLHCSGALHLRC